MRPNRYDGTLALTQIQEDKLDEVNWRNPYTYLDKQWDDKFKLLQRYKIENGHVRVPNALNYHGVMLGDWIKNKTSNHKTKLSGSRLNRMVAIGARNPDGTRRNDNVYGIYSTRFDNAEAKVLQSGRQ